MIPVHSLNPPRGAISIFFTVAVMALAAGWADVADAYSTGITGRTLKNTDPASRGCGQCHSPDATLGVSITGDATVAAGASSVYTVNVSGATTNDNIGVNIAASSGTLSESATNLYVSGGEITHTGTLANTGTGTTGSYSFTYTVPVGAAVGSTRTLYAAARAGLEWNHATNFVVTVPKFSQTITFPAQTSPRTYSIGATFSISPAASASSGLAITYTSDTPTICTTPGSTSTTVTMQGAGLCTIRANQDGNATYFAAADVIRSITINKGNQSVTFGSQVVTPSYSSGGTFNLSPAATASSGLAIVYVPVTPSICTKAASGIVVGMVAVGACQVQATQPGNVDWFAAPILASHTRTINIAKGAQTITFPTQSNKAFMLNGTFSLSLVSASSGLPITYTSLTPTICTTPGNTTNTVTMLDNGTCTIEASQGGNSNYNPAVDVSGNILLTETPLQPLISSRYPGSLRATIAFGSNGNGPSTTYIASCSASGQTTRTGSSTTVYSPIVVLNMVNDVTYTCSITASNSFGTSPPSLTGTVTPVATLAVPVFRSSVPPAALYTFNVGTSKTFRVVSTGTPNASVTRSSTLPAGMTYDIYNAVTEPKLTPGLGYLGGTPAAGTVGAHAITFTASNTGCGGTLEPPCPVQNFTINIAKGSPVISFTAPLDRVYSPTSFALAASIATPNSTLATTNIVYTSATPGICSVAGVNVTMLAVGTCTLNANSTTAASYTASYNAAPQVQRSFVISKASQTISFGAALPPTQTYAPGLTYTLFPQASNSAGLPVSYASVTTNVCTFAGLTVTVLGAGTCIIEASQDGNALYLAAPDVTQTTTINKANQTINFGAQAAQPYVPGGSFGINPLASATSGLAVDYISTTLGVCLVSGTNVQIVATGVCGIQASQPGDANYNPATPVTQNVTINAEPPSAPTLDDTFVNDATIRLYFSPPANDGGSPIINYRGTCNPGNVIVNSVDSPIVVGGLTNNVQYTCTVAAQNSAGFGALSPALNATPTLRTGAVLWNAVCANCHNSPPSGARFNAAGNTGTVINYVRANQPDMLADGFVQALTANELANIAQYIQAQMTPIAVNTPYLAPIIIDVGLPAHLYLGGIAFNVAEVVTGPTKGTLSAFTGTEITYTPGPGFIGVDTFTYRGKLNSLVLGEPRTLTITIGTPAAPVITSATTANGVFGQAFAYQITASNSPLTFDATSLPSGTSISAGTGLISGTSTAAGLFNTNVSATNPGGTGNLVVPITISKANQTITTFGAQANQSFATGSFAVSPLASASSGLTPTYSSLTPLVCTVSGITVTAVSAGLCTIAANQDGDTNFNAAIPFPRDLTITASMPGAPTLTSATPGDTIATLAFSAPANTGGTSITGYNATCTPSGSGGNSISPIQVSALSNGTQYSCQVRAVNSAGNGPLSNALLVTPQNTPVPPQFTSPNAFSFTVLSSGTFTVTASGTPAPTLSLISGTPPTGVSFTPGTGALTGIPATGTAAGSPYSLVFRATGTAPTADQTFALTVAKINQTINFANPGTQSFSLSIIPLTLSATSMLGVSLNSNSSSVCTVSGSNLTTVAPGVCSITATQTGNADYNAANQVTNVFTIAIANQSITFGAQSSPRDFSTAPFALTPVAFATSGLAIAYSTTTPSVCAMSGNNVNTLTAGVCTIAANQPGNANYNAAIQVTQSVTINAIKPDAPVIGISTGADSQVSVGFTPSASSGGRPIMNYTATCNPGNFTGTGSTSPVVVAGLTNGMQYTCSVTATNTQPLTSDPSGTVMVTPTLADGAALWDTTCSTCHGALPTGNQRNGSGSTATVLQHVRATQTLMLANAPVQALNAVELAAIAEFIGNTVPAIGVTTPHNAAVPVNVSTHITFTGHTTAPDDNWSAFTSVEMVPGSLSPSMSGSLSAFTGTSATFTPTNGFTGNATFTYRGKRTAPDVVGDPRTVTVTVLPAAPVLSNLGNVGETFGEVFMYQITANGSPTSFGASNLPPGLNVNTLTGMISGSANAPNAGTYNINISATNAGGTGMAALTIIIGKASQPITFPPQMPSSQPYVPGGSFAINPLAVGGSSGNPIVYTSTTTSVCTVNGVNVTIVTAGACVIAANQAGGDNYLPATQVTRDVTITAAVPDAPTIGAATAGDGTAQIAFTPPSETGGAPIASYSVSCSPSGSATGGMSPITVSGLTNLTEYTCSVQAINVAGPGAISATVNVTPRVLTAPDAPIIGVPEALNGAANILFSPPTNNGGSAIASYTATCNPGAIAANGSASPIQVGGLVNNTTYNCVVRATNAIGTSAPSAGADVTPQGSPESPQFTSSNATTFTVLNLGTFNVTATGVPNPTLSLLAGALPGGVSFTPATGVLTGTPATGTAAASPYIVTFRATGSGSPADQVFTLQVVKANQSISFTNPGTLSFSPSTIALTASATSGGAVSFTGTTPLVCTVSGNLLTTVAPGDCTITADQSGNGDFNAAPQVSRTFTIAAAPQTITFGAQTTPRNFSTSAFAINPLATASSSLPVAYNSTTPSICTVSGTAVTPVSPGVCTIAANQGGNANYVAATQVTQGVTINATVPGAPTIGTATASNGQATIAFTAPAFTGGSAITGYTATCNPGNVQVGGSTPSIVVTGLANNTLYTCSVRAQNAAGSSDASDPVNVTPQSGNGATVWGMTCGSAGCHAGDPSLFRLNVGGTNTAVLNYVVANPSPVMGTVMGLIVNGMSAQDKLDVAAYIAGFIPAVNATTPAGTPVNIDVAPQVFLNTLAAQLSVLEIVTPPAGGTLSAFTGTSVTYTPNGVFTGNTSFTYRARRADNAVATDIRTVTITVNPAAPGLVNASTSGTFGTSFGYPINATNTPTSYAATGLPMGLSINPANGLIGGTPNEVGTFMVAMSATNAGGTAMATLTLTIAPAAQTVAFPAQSPPTRNFASSGSFMISPPATGSATGNPIVYASLTTGVCTVSGTTVSMIAAGACNLTAQQSASTNFAASNIASTTVTVNAVAPAAPTIGVVSPGNGSASVGFTAPSQTGGAPIQSFTADCGGISASGGTSPIVVNGLNNGMTYSCFVTATNTASLTSAPSATVMVTPQAIQFANLVYSRKVHNGINRDITINHNTAANGLVDIEPRIGNTSHAIYFDFTATVSDPGSVVVTNVATGMPISGPSVSASGNSVVVALTGVPEVARITITLSGVNGALGASASMGLLPGDVNGTGRVTSADIAAIKARIGQPVATGNNYLFDVNLSGAISGADASQAKARSGLVIP